MPSFSSCHKKGSKCQHPLDRHLLAQPKVPESRGQAPALFPTGAGQGSALTSRQGNKGLLCPDLLGAGGGSGSPLASVSRWKQSGPQTLEEPGGVKSPVSTLRPGDVRAPTSESQVRPTITLPVRGHLP